MKAETWKMEEKLQAMLSEQANEQKNWSKVEEDFKEISERMF